eukprot:m51a1_g6324 hypothetical protein (314) ;mRNA; r:365929-366870
MPVIINWWMMDHKAPRLATPMKATILDFKFSKKLEFEPDGTDASSAAPEPSSAVPQPDSQPQPSGTLRWSGYDWEVRDTAAETSGPGPNFFAASNVRVDANGALVLSIAPAASAGGRAASAQVTGPALGFGMYSWDIEGTVESLVADPNAVLGLSVYHDDFNEIDLVATRWGQASAKASNLAYTNQPGSSGRTLQWRMPAGVAKHRQSFVWRPNSITWETRDAASGKLLRRWTSRTAPIPDAQAAPAQVLMNLWMKDGAAPRATPVQARFSKFRFTPLAGIGDGAEGGDDFSTGAGVLAAPLGLLAAVVAALV